MRRMGWMGWAPLLGLLAGSAQAEGLEGLGQWTGTGVVFNLGTKVTSSFTVEVTRTAVGSNAVQLKGTARMANGEEHPIDQKSIWEGNHFQIESARGRGNGICLGEGICASYEDLGGDQALATTIVLDGPDKMRLLMTELDHGQPVRLIRQSLTRKP